MTSLQRLLTVALAVALLLPAAAQASSSMETGIADDAALLNEPSDAKAAAAVVGVGRAGDRRRAHLRAVAGDRPRQLGGQGARRLRLGRSGQPGLQLVARGPRREPRQRRGHAPAARGHRPRPAVGLAGARPPQPALQAAARPLRPVRARGRAALRRGRRPLDHLERAQPAAVAAAAEHVRGQALHALRPAPLPPARARRLPGDQGGGPHLDRPLRRPRAARRERDEAERAHDAAGLHPLDGVRQGDAQARPQRALQGLQAARLATASPTTPMPRRARPTSRSRASTRRRSPTCRASSARSTAPSAPAA